MKKIIYLSIIVLTSCHYKNDELKILNNSSSSLCYETVIFNIKDSMYYLGPASDKLATDLLLLRLLSEVKLIMKNIMEFCIFIFFPVIKEKNFGTIQIL